MTLKAAAIAAALVATAGLTACATATPYQPAMRGQAVSGGFSEVRLEADRFRVNFAGNSLTSRDTVERYLLYRAAELTVAQGADWFSLVERQTDRKARTYVEPDPFAPYGPYRYWRPYWRYYGTSWGWRARDPWYCKPFWADRTGCPTGRRVPGPRVWRPVRGGPDGRPHRRTVRGLGRNPDRTRRQAGRRPARV